jgi:hypothetical protein
MRDLADRKICRLRACQEVREFAGVKAPVRQSRWLSANLPELKGHNNRLVGGSTPAWEPFKSMCWQKQSQVIFANDCRGDAV